MGWNAGVNKGEEEATSVITFISLLPGYDHNATNYLMRAPQCLPYLIVTITRIMSQIKLQVDSCWVFGHSNNKSS